MRLRRRLGVPLSILTIFAGPDWFLVNRYLLPPLVGLGLFGLVTHLVLWVVALWVGGLRPVHRVGDALGARVRPRAAGAGVAPGDGAGRARCAVTGRSWFTLWIVSTPSERLWARRAEWDDDRVRRPRPPVREPVALADVAARVAAGVELRAAAADFLDDLRWAQDPTDVASRIDAEPELVDPHTDAYLAALAEHVAWRHHVVAPAWCRGTARFLDHFWWPSRTVGLHARALVESPPAFRRRGIFIGRTTLERV